MSEFCRGKSQKRGETKFFKIGGGEKKEWVNKKN